MSGEAEPVAVVAPIAPPLPRFEHADAAPVAPQLSETAASLREKVAALARAVRRSKHLVVYTGAGVSTSAGVPDFRGQRGLDKVGWLSALAGQGVGPAGSDVLLPTFAHAAVTELHARGIVKAVVTSNHDNLHVMSGLPVSAVTAIFGNGNTETCLRCHATYVRHTQVPQLGRECDDAACAGRLKKHGVRFGGQINQGAYDESHRQARLADVALVLGSGMGVSPFCNLPTKAKHGAFLCAIQATPYDEHRRVKAKINATCDEVMRALLDELDIRVPDLCYQQPLRLVVADAPLPAGSHASHLTDPEQPPPAGDAAAARDPCLRLASRASNEAPTCVTSVALLVAGAPSEDEARSRAEAMLARVSTGEGGAAPDPGDAPRLGDDEDDEDDELGTAFDEHRLHYELALSSSDRRSSSSSSDSGGTWAAVRVRYRREYVWPSHAIVCIDTAKPGSVDWDFTRRATFYPRDADAGSASEGAGAGAADDAASAAAAAAAAT